MSETRDYLYELGFNVLKAKSIFLYEYEIQELKRELFFYEKMTRTPLTRKIVLKKYFDGVGALKFSNWSQHHPTTHKELANLYDFVFNLPIAEYDPDKKKMKLSLGDFLRVVTKNKIIELIEACPDWVDSLPKKQKLKLLFPPNDKTKENLLVDILVKFFLETFDAIKLEEKIETEFLDLLLAELEINPSRLLE